MDVIYSYKKIDGYIKKMDDRFYQMARISVNSAKKHYNTILYTDSECKKLFKENNVNFDKIIVLDDIENYNNMFYSLIKLFAMRTHSGPFIHIDLDTIITNHIDVKTDTAFGYSECYFNDVKDVYLNDFFMNSYYRLLKKLFPNKVDTDEYDFRIVPNASLFYCKTKKIKKIINDIIDYFDESIWLSASEFEEKYNTSIGGYSSLIEQFFIYHFIQKYNISCTFLNEIQQIKFNELDIDMDNRKYNYGIISIQKLFENKFIHFQNYNDLHNNIRYMLHYIDESLKPKTII